MNAAGFDAGGAPNTSARPHEEVLVKKFRCGDVVPGCARSFVGSQDEILLAVRSHARAIHGLDEVPESVLDAVRAATVDA